MAMAEERLRILRMVQAGKLTPEEGAELIDALEGGRGMEANPEGTLKGPGRGPRWFRVRVTDTNTGRQRVNVRLPVGLVTAGIKMGARFSPEIEGLDMNALLGWINAGETGQVLDVVDDKDGEHVEAYLE